MCEVIWDSEFSCVTAFLLCDLKQCERANLRMDGLIYSCKSEVILVLCEGHYENILLFSCFSYKKICHECKNS